MLAVTDVHYPPEASVATAACVIAAGWTDGVPIAERTAQVADPQPYVPGHLALRELPALLAVLAATPESLTAIVVDGYVWLGGERAGLGARLWEAIGHRAPVIGIAKNPFAGATAIPVLRGRSARPLYISAAGIAAQDAANRVAQMHGAHRLPSLVRRADHLCRGLQ